MNIQFPKIEWPLDAEKWKSIQKWIDQVKDLLANRISYRTNMDSEIVELEFAAGATPSKRVSMTARPMGVIPLSIQQISPASNTPPTVSDAFSWTYADGSLSFPSWGTLTGTARYRATVLILRS